MPYINSLPLPLAVLEMRKASHVTSAANFCGWAQPILSPSSRSEHTVQRNHIAAAVIWKYLKVFVT